MNRTQAFLKDFRERMGLFGTPEGRQRKYDESKKNILGMPLPEFGVSEFLQMPDRSGAIERQEKEKKEREKLPDSFNQDKYFRGMRNMMLTDSLLREAESRLQARRDVNVMKQTLPLVDLYAETAAQRRLMEDKFSPTKISQQRLRAQMGEAGLMQAVANQASAGAQIGGLGTGRRFGRG
jgi:hypothetical protein|tara:strand:- start:164 stop:703 length:540 start_codon:yes stop_codon:yes gene_type:complete